MQWKDKSALYSFTTKKLTRSMCQVSLVVKYKWIYKFGEIISLSSEDIERKQNSSADL